MQRLTRRRFVCLAGACAAALASVVLKEGDGRSIPPRIDLRLGPSNGIDDTPVVQAAIDHAAGMATYFGIPSTIHGQAGEAYRVTYTGRLISIPKLGPVRAALSLASHVSLEGLNIQAPDWPGAPAAVFIAESGLHHWGIRHCMVVGNAPNGLATEYLHTAVLLGSGADVTIEGNTLNRFRGPGISGISSNQVTSRSITVKGNTITQCQGGAIKFGDGVTDLLIAGNRCVDNLGLISGSYRGAECIFLNDSRGRNRRIRITGNLLANWGACIAFGGASDVEIRDNYLAPPPGGACFATAPGSLVDAHILYNTMVGAVNAAAVDIPRSVNVQVSRNSFYGRYVNPVFIRELGAGTGNDYRGNVLAFTAEGSGSIRIIRYAGSGSEVAPQCNVGIRRVAPPAMFPGSSTVPVCSGRQP